MGDYANEVAEMQPFPQEFERDVDQLLRGSPDWKARLSYEPLACPMWAGPGGLEIGLSARFL